MTSLQFAEHRSDDFPSLPQPLADDFAARARELDEAAGFPRAEIGALAGAGLLALPGSGSAGHDGAALAKFLRALGRANLSVGRLYEGHVNARQLITLFGSADQRRRLASDCAAGRLHAVWNTDGDRALTLVPCPARRDRWRLDGGKILASGAGEIERPLITATLPDGSRQMVLVELAKGTRADLSGWTARGMRASLTGSVDFSGIEVDSGRLIGVPGDYLREPHFSGGAWRFAAVQLGGAEAMGEILRDHLCRSGRDGDPHQRTRFAEVAAALETGRLWVEEASRRMADGRAPADDLVAYVNLARLEVERACLTVIDRTERSIGLRAFLRPHPAERIGRDLSTYLRQPAPDRARMVASEHLLAAGRPMGRVWE